MKRIFSVIIGLAVALGALQAQNNTVTVGDVTLLQGGAAEVSVELSNETEFSAFQMDLKLPEGFVVATTLNEDGDEVLDIALNEQRKKSTHSLSYNVLNSGAVRVASFSNTNAVYEGASGEIVTFRIMATDEAILGTYFAELYNVVFTTPDAVDHRLPNVTVRIDYSSSQGGDVEQEGHEVEVHSSPYGRCICDGYVIEAGDSEVISGVVEDGYELKLYFVPFEGYMASSMKRNGEVVAIRNNIYEENVTEDVAFTDVNYVTIVDTLVVTETVVDTLVQTETIVDTLVVTETVVDTLVQTETIVDTLVVTETVVDTLVQTETIVDTLVVTETVVDTLVQTETIVDTLFVTEIVVDTLVLTETIVDTMLVEVVDTVFFETIDTIFVPEYEALPIPVITCDSGVVTITCSSADVAILYAINGDPMEGSIYTSPFEAPTDAVISAVAVKRGEMAVLNLAGEGVEQAQMRVVSRRYYNDSGVAVTSPEEGITIVVAEYEDGSTRVYKMVKR